MRDFGDYELLEEIGHGGMGVVYRARQKSLDRIVALKVLLFGPHASAESVKRFRAEAVATAALQHPHIVAIHEVGFRAGQHFIAMDFIEGQPLSALIRGSPLPAHRAASYLKAIADAIHYAHERGILHRDLKPANVLIDANDQPRVTDFGLAKRLSSTSDSGLQTQDLTASGQLLGSPNYMPPEQAIGKGGTLSRRSDVYALGAILYHALTGRPPFVGEGLAETVQQVLNEEPVSPRLFNPAVPRDLETVCVKCLEKDPGKRYATAQMLAEELDRWREGKSVLARPIGPAGKAWRWCQRNPRLATAVGVALVSLLGGLVGVSWQWRRAESEWQRAEAGELTARQNAYAADMLYAQRALADGDLGRAKGLLDNYRPKRNSDVPSAWSDSDDVTRHSPPVTDLRHWEWRYLWAGSRSEEQSRLPQGSNRVTALAFSANGKWLAVRERPGTVTLWDPAAKRLVAQLPGSGGHKALAFAPREDLLAWGGLDDRGAPVVRLLEAGRQREVAWLPQSAGVVALAFAPDGRLLATLGEDGTVSVWALATRQLVAAMPAAIEVQVDTPEYGCVRVSPNGRVLAVGGKEPVIRVWDWVADTTTELLPSEPADGLTALDFSPDGNLLAAGCGYFDNRIHLWDLTTRTERLLVGHRSWIEGLAFAPDGKTLASASADQTIGLWYVGWTTETRRLRGSEDEVHAVAWSPDGRELVSGGKDGTVRYWAPNSGPTSSRYARLPVSGGTFGLAFARDDQSLLVLNQEDGSVVRRDAITLREAETLSFLGTNLSSVALSADSRLLAVGDRLGHAAVWDFKARRAVTNLVLPATKSSEVLQFSAAGHVLLCHCYRWSSVEGHTLRLWSTATWQELDLGGIPFEGLFGAALAPDERTLALAHRNGTITWWDLRTGQRKALLDCQRLGDGLPIAFSPDGRWFAAGGDAGWVFLWDVATKRARQMPRAHLNQVNALAFSPDGRRLMTTGTGANDAVRLWDLDTGREVATLTGEPGFNDVVGFSPDGNTIFACGWRPVSGYRALLWRAPSWDEITTAEARAVTP